jgi:hypothetical protein
MNLDTRSRLHFVRESRIFTTPTYQHKQTPHIFTTQTSSQTPHSGLKNPRSHQVASFSPPRYSAASSSPRTIHTPRGISRSRAYTRDPHDVGYVAKSPGLCVCVNERARARARARARGRERQRETSNKSFPPRTL